MVLPLANVDGFLGQKGVLCAKRTKDHGSLHERARAGGFRCGGWVGTFLGLIRDVSGLTNLLLLCFIVVFFVVVGCCFVVVVLGGGLGGGDGVSFLFCFVSSILYIYKMDETDPKEKI